MELGKARSTDEIIKDIKATLESKVKDKVPTDWKVQTSDWTVENSRRWKTEDSDRFFYNVEEKKDE